MLMAVAAMMGKLAHRRVEEGMLLSRDVVPGERVEVYRFASAVDGWIWATGIVRTINQSIVGMFRVECGKIDIPCFLVDEWDGETLLQDFHRPCTWRWPR